MPQKSWAVGEEVLATDFNTYMQNQVIPQFTGTAQRDSQWASPPTGALCVTTDTNTVWQRAAGGWFKPYGEWGYQQTAADVIGIQQAYVTVCTTTFTIPTGVSRRVHLNASMFMFKGAGDAAAIAVVRFNIDGTAGVSRSHNIGNTANAIMALSQSTTLAAGSHTIKTEAYNTASFLNVAAGATLSVLDAGAS
jgi:hypothetical protein